VAPLDAEQARVLARPDLTASVPDIEWADAVLVLETELVDEMPILELRVRKGRRRNGVKVTVASSHPSALDRDAAATVRFAPGSGEALLAALAAALGSDRAPRARAEEPVPDGIAAEAEPVGHAAELPHGDPVGTMGEVVTEPDPGAPAPVSGPGGDAAPEASAPGATDDSVAVLADRAGADPDAIRSLAATLRAAGSVVIIWGERLSHGPRGKQAIDALLALAQALNIPATEGSGLLEVPAGTNGRGLREVGVLPNFGPGFSDASGRGAAEIADALAGGQASALVLLHADPIATHPDRRRWEEALDHATFVVAFAEFLDGGIAEYADVVLPAESYAEREGTVVHPDGRLQRVRQTVGHPGEVRAVWWQLEQILSRLGHGTGAQTAPMVSEQIFNAVPFYDGLTLDEIGGRGVRWQERDAASKLQAPELPTAQLDDPPAAAEANGVLRLGTRPSLWTGYVPRHAPVLEFLNPKQTLELSPADAERLGVGTGTPVRVGVNGTRVRATATVRANIPVGTAYLIDGTDEEPANLLTNGRPQTVEVTPA
jgi:NADH-quinone oxidoreductase subunit G